MLKRISRVFITAFLILPTIAVAGCGGPSSGFTVSLSSITGGSLEQGQPYEEQVAVKNISDSTLTNVGVNVELPGRSEYLDTVSDSSSTVPRVTPIDPTQDGDPIWGTWSLGAAGSSSSVLDIDFTFTVAGSPGSYSLTANATDGTFTETATSAVSLVGEPGYRLGLSASPGSANQGQNIVYTATIINTGAGAGSTIELLLNLPPGVQYEQTLGINADSGVMRSISINPPPGSEEVFYGDWTMNGLANNQPPATVTIQFEAYILPDAPTGTVKVTGQLTDGNDTVIPIVNAGKLTITPAPKASPSSPSASPSP